MASQQDLFADPTPGKALPAGMQYRTDFITLDEERTLLEFIGSLQLENARYRQYTARRKTVSFGAGYDFTHNIATPAPEIPAPLGWLRERAASWVGIESGAFVQALIARYEPGTPLGWHRDVPNYELIVGLSLASAARIRFRPYPWSGERSTEVFALNAAARSAYVLAGPARWQWQHSVPPVKTLRYSITLRTANQERLSHPS